MRKFMGLAICISCVSCSEGSNFNQLFVGKDQKAAVDYLLERGQHFYDKKQFDKALEYAGKAYQFNSGNEEAAILLAYSHLAVAGVDIFSITENLIDQGDTATTLADATTTATDSLTKLGAVIGITDADDEAMMAENNSVEVNGRTVTGASDNPLFEAYPLELPKSAVDARKAASNILQHIDQAIHVICPFVDDSVKIYPHGDITAEDPRHTAANCPATDAPKRNGAKSHFLWALSHIGEGVAFNTFFGAINLGITARASAIENKNGTTVAISDYVDGLAEIADIINVIMPTDPDDARDSMLRAIFNDLDAAALGFAQIPGIPDSVTKSITDGMANLRAKSKTLDDTRGDKDVVALKDQLLESTAKKIREEMTKRESSMTPDQKAKACEAYNSITTAPFDLCS